MPTTIYSSGPAGIIVSMHTRGYGTYALLANQNTQRMLGWCERSPIIEVSGAFTPLFNTLGGVELPYTYLYQGAEGVISATLTRWDDILLQRLETVYLFGVPVAMQSRAVAANGISVAIVFPLHVSTASNMHAWINFFPVCLLERVERKSYGNMPGKVTVQFRAIRSHVITSPNWRAWDFGLGAMDLGAYGGGPTDPTTAPGGGLPNLTSIAATLNSLVLANIV